MTDLEFDRVERDLFLLRRDLQQDRLHRKVTNKKIKILQNLQRRNEELLARSFAERTRILAELHAMHSQPDPLDASWDE